MSTAFTAKFPGYAERVRQSLRDQPFMDGLLGATATRIEPGLVEITLPMTPQLLQPYGNVHGTVATAAADGAAGYAAQTLLAEGYDVVTVEYKINFLAPGIGDHLTAVGEVVRAGRTLSVCAADIFAVANGERKLFAHLTATMMAVENT